MRIGNKFKFAGSLAFIIVATAALIMDASRVTATVPYITERVNLTPSGSQTASGNVQDAPIISQDGRFVSFATSSSDIIAGDTNNKPDIFVRDRKLGTTVRANLSSTGTQLNTGFGDYRMSANGRYVIFNTYGSVVPGTPNSKWHLYLRDLKNNTTEMVSLTSTGGMPSETTSFFDISADGRYVVFTNSANNIVAGDTNSKSDIFVRDRKLGTTVLLSKSGSGAMSDASSSRPSISCDGSYVTFLSAATNLVSGDTNNVEDLFLVDRVAGDVLTNITVVGNGNANANVPNVTGEADISCNGQTISFLSNASNLVSNDTNGKVDIFAYDMVDSTIQRVNLDSSGGQTNGEVYSLNSNSLDFSGRYIAFMSYDSTLVAGDNNSTNDLFLRDLLEGTTQIISKRNATTQTVQMGSTYYAISLDGREVVYPSADTGLVSGDTNNTEDIFVSKTGI